MFPDALTLYLKSIKDAIRRKSHHDQRRHLFLDFLRRGFDIEAAEFELEHKVKVAEVRGRIDALLKSAIFEFKSHLEAELPAAEVELKKYFEDRPRPSEYVALVTDGLSFVVYRYSKGTPTEISRFVLPEDDPISAFRLLDQFIFSSNQITPQSSDITTRFGLHSAVFSRCREILETLFEHVRERPSVRVKFREWNALLGRVYGSAIGDETLFLKHTYLTMLSRLLVAKALAPATERQSGDYAGMITGEFFRGRNLINLAEPDFFSWATDSPVEKDFIGFMAKLEDSLKVFDLRRVTEDILKEIYQELVDPESRHALGEYYTPDWLADLTFEILSYTEGRVLDPACGSGSFLLAAIRRKRSQGLKGQKLLRFAVESVLGIDVHPVAVLMTKANVILQLADEIRATKHGISLPVYMADTLLVSENPREERIKVSVSEDEAFSIPLATLREGRDVDMLADAVTEAARLSPSPIEKTQIALKGLETGVFSGMEDREQFYWKQNFKLMAKLMAEERDSIYGYILKNAHRPAFIRQTKVDYVVGNPPWLSYRYIDDAGYKKEVKRLTLDLHLLDRRQVRLFTQMDTSTLFYAYCERDFLKPNGSIAFVLPKTAILPAKQHAGFQSRGVSEIHDFTDVSPLFNVRAALVVRRPGGNRSSAIPTTLYKASLPRKNITWSVAKSHFETKLGTTSFAGTEIRSPFYHARFQQGATLVPRCMWFVQRQKGAAANLKTPHLETSEGAYDEAKDQWRLRMRGPIERAYLYETILSKGLLPFLISQRELVFLPVRIVGGNYVMADSSALLEQGDLRAASWMTAAEKRWQTARKGRDPIALHEWLNYGGKIVQQLPKAGLAVLYNTSGTNISAALLEPEQSHASGLKPSGFIAESVTYYYYPKSQAEGLYLVAVLNSGAINEMIKEFQPEGLFGERHIHRRPFEACHIPQYNSSDRRHVRLAALARECIRKVAKPAQTLDGTLARRRAFVRQLIADQLAEIDGLVQALLEEPEPVEPGSALHGVGRITLSLFP